jgi:hypothetical protein
VSFLIRSLLKTLSKSNLWTIGSIQIHIELSMLFVENVGIRWLRLETHITHMTHVVLVHVLQLEKMPWRCTIHDRLSVIAKECRYLWISHSLPCPYQMVMWSL